MDAIDQVLDGLRLRSSVFSRMELGPGWGFAKDCLGGAPFHIVIEGEAWVGHHARDLVRLTAGEMAVVPRGEAHLLLSGPDAEPVPFSRVARETHLPEWAPGLRIKPRVLRIGGDGPPVARLLSGIFEFTDRRRNPLLAALPDLLLLRGAGAGRGTLAAIGRLIDEEVGAAQPGAALVAGRLADYLFIQAVREHALAGGDGAAGWLPALRDPVIGRALTLIHTSAERPWSVAALAREVSLSRSQFAERFKGRVGQGPAEYLRRWRLFQASTRVEEGQMPLKEIADRAGYRSVAAFGRAFRAWGGVSPAAARRAAAVV